MGRFYDLAILYQFVGLIQLPCPQFERYEFHMLVVRSDSVYVCKAVIVCQLLGPRHGMAEEVYLCCFSRHEVNRGCPVVHQLDHRWDIPVRNLDRIAQFVEIGPFVILSIYDFQRNDFGMCQYDVRTGFEL